MARSSANRSRASHSRAATSRFNALGVVLACSVAVALCMGCGASQAFQRAALVVDQGVVNPDTSASSSSTQDTSTETVLGSYRSSSTSDDAARANNIALAAQALNGTVVQPGAQLSFNSIVGNTAEDSRYQMAAVLDGTSKVSGPGGGICQVSSALYIASLNAGLEIVERHPHSMPLDYAPTGLDATVDYGNLDLIIRNNTGSPLTVYATAQGQTVEVTIKGVPATTGETAESHANIVSVQPSDEDADLQEYVVDSYRTYYLNGTAERTEFLSEDHYQVDASSTVEATTGNEVK